MKKLFGALILLLLIGISNAESNSGELELRTNDDKVSPSLLLDTKISGDINGLVARINVQQHFKNDSESWVHGKYHFPLPEGAAIDSLTITIGERVIKAIVKEKEAAKKTFENAKRDGKKAGLLQQHRPNIFSFSVANIAPYEDVIADISFVDLVRFDNQEFSLALPTTFTPRYVPNALDMSPQNRVQFEQKLGEEVVQAIQSRDSSSQQSINVNGWIKPAPRPKDAKEIQPPQRYPNQNERSHHFSVALNLNAGLPLSQISSTHTIDTIVKSGDGNPINQVTLSNGQELMNSDFVLRWKAAIGSSPQAAIFSQTFKADQQAESLYTLVMLTPPSVNSNLNLPRDLTFIIDSSGSMAGTSMQQAKQALHRGLDSLSAADRFNIVDFDSSFRPLYSQSQTASVDQLRQARKMVDSLHADGGTEMLGALQFAMRSPSDSNYLKQIIFITDGSVGYERAVFKDLFNDLGDARLFTVGIGSAPNSYFMSKAAKFGRGSYTYIRNLNEVSAKMTDLFKKIRQPLMRDIEIDWEQPVEQFPSRIPDLYAGEPIMVIAKSDSIISNINVKGSMLNTPWKQKLKHQSKHNSANLNTVWARKKIAYLMDKFATGEVTEQDTKAKVLPLALEHQLLSKYTSFVAVEKTPSKPKSQQAKNKRVPNLMPKGSTMPIPQTATPASLLALIGLFFLTLAGFVRRSIR